MTEHRPAPNMVYRAYYHGRLKEECDAELPSVTWANINKLRKTAGYTRLSPKELKSIGWRVRLAEKPFKQLTLWQRFVLMWTGN